MVGLRIALNANIKAMLVNYTAFTSYCLCWGILLLANDSYLANQTTHIELLHRTAVLAVAATAAVAVAPDHQFVQ